MNKHIELVKRWMADNDSVTSARLHANYDSACDAADAAAAALLDAVDARDAAIAVVNVLDAAVDAAVVADTEAALAEAMSLETL